MADNYTPIVTKTGKTPMHSAGSWGHRYSVVLDDGTELYARAKTELDALETLRQQVDERFPDDLPDFTPKTRVRLEVEAAEAVGPAGTSLLSNGHQEGAHTSPVPGCPDCQTAPRPSPGPKAKGDTVRAVGSQRACDMSCVFAHRDDCKCQCMGQNHMSGWALFAGLKVGKIKVAVIEEGFAGPKRTKEGRDCLCGCGAVTKGGLFLQGHDRKLHAKMGEIIDGQGFFKEEDGVGLVMTPLGRKTLREAKK